MNNCVISGFVCKDPIIGHVRTGAKVVDFSVAVRDDRRNAIGVYETYYFRVSCWGYVADFVEKYIHKDNYVMVQGKMTQSKWKDPITGKSVYGFQLVADHVENGLVSGGRKTQKDPGGNNLTDYVDAPVDESGTNSMYT